jgi:hypothetical protein
MSKKSITKKYNINGPVNVFRLTNNKKVVYIFGDFHNNLNNQTECVNDKNSLNINIDQFFRKIFKKYPDKKFDFFYEGFVDVEPKIDKNQHDNFTYNFNYRTNKYFIQILKLVFNNIELVDNKIHTSKQFDNARLHYFNFRNQLPHMKYILDNGNNFYQLRISNKYNNIITELEKYKQIMSELKNFLLTDKNIYIVKIKSKYQNEDIQKIILHIFNNNVIKYLDLILEKITETISYIKNTSELYNVYIPINIEYDLRKKIYTNMTILSDHTTFVYANITDIYLVRRLVDKEYINNCIIYAGAYHMNHIAYILIKYFNYEITHIANIDKSLKNEDINKFIKSKNIIDYDDYRSLGEYLWNNSYQCSNLSNFPDNLE